MAWRLLDPLLVKLNSRMDHLREMHPRESLRSKFKAIAEFGSNVTFMDGAKVDNCGDPADLNIGEYTHIAGELRVIAPNGKLRVGKHCFLGAGSRIWAQTSVIIGDFVLIAHDVDIHDTNAHPVNAVTRRRDPINLFELDIPIDWTKVESRSVVIEDDVWIGFKSSILKGVTIGRGAVVAAGSMVTKDVPPYTVVAGNPAVVIKHLES